MVLHTASSNLSEALINVKKSEQNFLQRGVTVIHREQNKIRANVDRHMETFLQMTRKRHETWYRHDKHFREAIRKEKENHEKRKERNRQKLILASNPEYVPRDLTPFQAVLSESDILPPIATATPQPPSTTSPIPPPSTTSPVPPPLPPPPIAKITSPPPPTAKITSPPPAIVIKKMNTSTTTTPRSEPMTKVERRTHQVLRASQKLLDESAARSRYKYVFERPSSVTFNMKRSTPLTSTSSSVLHRSTLIVPITTSLDCEEYDRLMNESLQQETFSEFVDHFVKFRPEFREQFGLINEARKRQKAIEKLREFNQIYAKAKDERYHKLISSLTDLPSEQKQKFL
ncbi:unnamed protein product [Rotaria magnacalcarata]|uniref:Uncharacterized protein n=1 Tax=Rotaria magnacalcarata TaxID=392030 RepID=A0A816VXA8_9BILA|nr:unnamed protein product [Rotaria magnacalcarata]CAF2126275.1 unnamed protein product [Rotaria magnacalcarata]CAF3868239.1 unnamed protein product [Rotaria magnacalcarata]CAF3912414.1 unnamed protein product [Rotaria magnacalcarata]